MLADEARYVEVTLPIPQTTRCIYPRNARLESPDMRSTPVLKLNALTDVAQQIEQFAPSAR